jgi:hypothetical protein
MRQSHLDLSHLSDRRRRNGRFQGCNGHPSHRVSRQVVGLFGHLHFSGNHHGE